MKSGATESSYYYLSKYFQFPDNVYVGHDPHAVAQSTKPIKIIWSHHSYDQPCYAGFDHNTVDYIVCPSLWLKQQFIKYHKIPEHKLVVIPNGVSDKFQFSDKKTKTLIHTSVPYKGLILLPHIFPIVRKAHPDCILKVFSSMSLYGEVKDDPYIDVYSELIRMPNVLYSPAVDNDYLVEHYQDAALFVHPNIWEETSCVSLIEAQRSGCYPILSDIGALSETCGEIGTLVTMDGKQTTSGWSVTEQFINTFAAAIIAALDHFDNNRAFYDEASRAGALHAAQNHDWSVIAAQWQNFIRNINGKEIRS
jgi:glycosyltransferase involved in cell wall biosynthesis